MDTKIDVTPLKYGTFTRMSSYFDIIEEISSGHLSISGGNFEFSEQDIPLVPPILELVELFYVECLPLGDYKVPLPDTERWLNVRRNDTLCVESIEGPGYVKPLDWIVSPKDAKRLLEQIERLFRQADVPEPVKLLLHANPVLRAILKLR